MPSASSALANCSRGQPSKASGCYLNNRDGRCAWFRLRRQTSGIGRRPYLNVIDTLSTLLIVAEENPVSFWPLTRATFELRYGAYCPLDRALLTGQPVALRCGLS